MRKAIFLFSSIALYLQTDAQGAWNIGYVQVDSIDADSWVGMSVKIDFAGHCGGPYFHNVRFNHDLGDTAMIVLSNGDTMRAVERWNVWVDDGNYQNQYLDLYYPDSVSTKLRVDQSELKSMESGVFTFELFTSVINRTGKKEKVTGNRTVSASVPKKDLSGILYKISKYDK